MVVSVANRLVVAADGLRQILNVRQLARGGRRAEIGGELRQLVGRRRITVRLGGLRRRLQVARDLRGYLLILGWIRLLQLLQCAQQLRERRKLAAIGRLSGDAADTTAAIGLG